ncbi:type IV secretion system protein VirB5 [Bartonella callosciuri]|uniref:Type IV secretion system protein VirB5 n=1 Tax=Bartonella callosciuri TaxID=686223 RepID=A0A840NWD4_9HYPH|nr:type IV secretion system protein [Bartonella callosciuri]MBB5074255.1 type IV secretion system protein VirB5 [Bartonella callosciuri]
MKRIIISVVIAVIFATPSTAVSFLGIDEKDLSLAFSNWRSSNSSKNLDSSQQSLLIAEQKLLAKNKNIRAILDVLKEQLELKKKQLAETEKTYNSITGKGKFSAISTNYTSFFLKNPQSVYSENIPQDILASLEQILQEESISNSISDARDSIYKRSQYVAAVDKATSLQTFQEAENRFDTISKLLNQIDKTNNLKDIAELKARLKAKLAMIQNEAVKLQMVAYMRNAERALIHQQKRKRNMKILNSKNTAMPTIQSIR